MKNLGQVKNPKDLVNKEYVDKGLGTKISSIVIGAKTLPIDKKDNSVVVPVAGALCGVVKSTNAVNGITVKSDGTMRVNKLTVDNLMVAEGDFLWLVCGDSQEVQFKK